MAGHKSLGYSRREFIRGAVALSALAPAWAFAEELIRTPRVTEGPFYPDKLPLDTDNDLLILNDTITPAVGTVTHLSGHVLDRSGSPAPLPGSKIGERHAQFDIVLGFTPSD